MSEETIEPVELIHDGDTLGEGARKTKEAVEKCKQATENARRIREEIAQESANTVREAMDTVIRIASEATGMTREQLLEQAAQLPEPEPIEPVALDPMALYARRMKAAGVPPLHVRHLTEERQECEAVGEVRVLSAKHGGAILVLSGGVGTRKTGSACLLLATDEGGVFVEASSILAIAIEDKKQYLRIKQARLVVLDDLGTEIPDEKGYWLKEFNTLMNAWYANEAKVVITCNLTVEQFKQRYGERVVDRIRECGRFVEIGGASVRGR